MVIIIESVLNIWNLHDVCNTSQHIRLRLEDKAEYQGLYDGCLVWMDVEPPEYLENWHQVESSQTRRIPFPRNLQCSCIFVQVPSCLHQISSGRRGIRVRANQKVLNWCDWNIFCCGFNDAPTPVTFLNSANRIVQTSIGYASLNGKVPVKDFINNENRTVPIERSKKAKELPTFDFLTES